MIVSLAAHYYSHIIYTHRRIHPSGAQMIPLLRDGMRWVGFWIEAVHRPGDYHLQISGCLGRSNASNSVVFGCITTSEIKVEITHDP